MLLRGSVGAACPGSAQEGPVRCAATVTSLAERRAGGSCVPTWASSWSCLCRQARCDYRGLQQARAPLLTQLGGDCREGIGPASQALGLGLCHAGRAYFTLLPCRAQPGEEL